MHWISPYILFIKHLFYIILQTAKFFNTFTHQNKAAAAQYFVQNFLLLYKKIKIIKNLTNVRIRGIILRYRVVQAIAGIFFKNINEESPSITGQNAR